MSVERSFEAWEEVQRQSQDLADRLAQGFNGLINPDRFAQGFNGLIHSHITPPSFSWPNPPQPPKLFDVEFPKHNFVQDFKVATNYASAIDGVSAIFDMGNRLGKAGTEFGASVNGVVQQFFRMLPLPFKKNEDNQVVSLRSDVNRQGLDLGVTTKVKEDIGSLTKRFQDFGFVQTDGSVEEEVLESNVNSSENIDKQQQGSLSITSTYDSRRSEVQTSLAARGDLWRVEASRGNYTPGSENSSLFLVQLGPVLFVRDSTLLLPVHLSKQHLLWYGYDRKNGMHSICPAVWSKNRSWLLMSMICLNPLACSFMDLQLPNGQLTYVYGEGFSTSAFLPFRGGLLQAQGRYPGETMFSYSRKNKWGTRITPTVQWPDKSFTLSLAQGLAWKRSGLMVKPSVQISLHPTFGGSNPGVRAEVVHSVKEELSLIIGCALATHPSAYASVSLGRSKWNGNVGSSGIVARAETPLGRVGRPWFSIQINSGLEF